MGRPWLAGVLGGLLVASLAGGGWLLIRVTALNRGRGQDQGVGTDPARGSKTREEDALEERARQLAEARLEEVLQGERKRIAADLHDDLGARLLTIIHTSGSERISALAREALQEMRLSVRGLAGRPVRLTDALGDWRAETVSRLQQAGIEADWRAPDDLPQTLPAPAWVQTTRMLREAVSNVIHHSRASHCEVECRLADGALRLSVRDDGQGMGSPADDSDRAPNPGQGQGLESMRQRAARLHGQCLVDSAPGRGTVIRLTIPLDPATPCASSSTRA